MPAVAAMPVCTAAVVARGLFLFAASWLYPWRAACRPRAAVFQAGGPADGGGGQLSTGAAVTAAARPATVSGMVYVRISIEYSLLNME